MPTVPKGYHYVPGYKWKLGRKGTHPGYKRKNRPKGKKRILSRPPDNLRLVRDEYGQWKGYKLI